MLVPRTQAGFSPLECVGPSFPARRDEAGDYHFSREGLWAAGLSPRNPPASLSALCGIPVVQILGLTTDHFFLSLLIFCLSRLVLGDFLGFLSHTCCRIFHPSSRGELEERVASQHWLIHRPYWPAPLEAVSSAALGYCWPGTWTTCQALSPPRGFSSKSPVVFACPNMHSPCFSGWGMHLPGAASRLYWHQDGGWVCILPGPRRACPRVPFTASVVSSPTKAGPPRCGSHPGIPNKGRIRNTGLRKRVSSSSHR